MDVVHLRIASCWGADYVHWRINKLVYGQEHINQSNERQSNEFLISRK
jgi:hypothetical protein